MRNSLLPAIFSGPDSAPRRLASGSPWRLMLLGGVFVVAAAAVLWRTAQIQAGHSGAWLNSLRATSVEEEWLPARDGRILADSQVLAEDVDLSDVRVHYRWLQAEADPNWVKLQLRQRLTREERRDPERVQAAEEQLRDEREQLLQTLADTTRVPLSELLARRDRIDAQVMRLQQVVNQRARVRAQQTGDGSDEAEDEAGLDSADEPAGIFFRWAGAVRSALTTPPRREAEQRIVVREEESWHTLLEDVAPEITATISEQPERFPGVRIVSKTRRTYPHPDTAVHLTGARTAGGAGTSSSGADSDTESINPTAARVGRFGVEKSYNSQLAGVPGLRRIVRDRRQRVVRTELVREPVSGRDVLLTINWQLQLTVEQLLSEALGDAEPVLLRPAEKSESPAEPPELPEPDHIPVGGAVVVMEADSGRIAALASAPEFDLSLFTDGTTAQWDAVNSDVRRPFVSRFLAMSLPPGSTWKMATALAAMEAGVIAPDERFECQGYLRTPQEHRCLTFRLFGHGHGPVTLRTALAQSCNVYFFDAAARLGTEPQAVWAERLGFGQRTGIDLPFESAGQVPRLKRGSGGEQQISERERKRFEREALGFSIGQSRLTVTPLQLARFTACIANGGWLVTPHIASEDGQSMLLEESAGARLPERRRVEGIDDEQLQAIREGLIAAVNDPIGTGYNTVRLPNLRIAGKTGTAEAAPGKPDHAWFAGWFPAEQPEFVVVAVLEHGGSGSRAAGPIVREIARSLLNTHPSGPHSVPVSQSPVRVRSRAF